LIFKELKYVGSTGKPMIISAGMAHLEGIKDAAEAAFSNGGLVIIL
jgi:sialic acid synthase SpsE